MAKNKSNQEKTIKTEMQMMKSDLWTIDSMSLYSNYLGQVILPNGLILDEYRDYFENLLETIELDERYYYSPTLFAEDYYGTPDLDFLVLYFAKMKSLFEFNTETISVLPNSSLVDINKLIVNCKDDVTSSRNSPDVYEKFDDIKPTSKSYLSYTTETPEI